VAVASIDDRLAVWVATHRWGPLDDPFVWLGTVGRLGLVWAAVAVIVGAATGRGLRGTILLAVVTWLAAFAADSASFGVKDLVHRTRPFVAHPQIHPLYVVHSTSFPAGHAATAFAGATLLSYVAPRAAPALIALALLIGFSRVYVGVHYPSDVLAGAAIGVLVGLVAIALFVAVRRRFAGRPPVAASL
jgi:undecaprenyl-diphosphatase